LPKGRKPLAHNLIDNYLLFLAIQIMIGAKQNQANQNKPYQRMTQCLLPS